MKYKRKKESNFWELARKFLHDYMPLTRNLSNKSVEAYKQSIKMYLSFLKEKKDIEDENVTFDSFSKDNVTEFILWMKEKGCAPKTMNLRLTAIRSFLKYAGEEDFELRGIYVDVCKIKKIKENKQPIEYLQPHVTKAILSAYDTGTIKSRRNRMILILMYDTGARVQETADLNISSLHLNVKNPFITLIGKGRKTRNVPLTNKTVLHLKEYLKEFHKELKEAPLFYSKLDGRPHRLSTDSISLILKKAADIARIKSVDVPKNVHCHMLRKTKAMDLYKSGVPLPFIMQLLGHESMSTTSGFYAFATLEMMAEAMNKSSPPVKEDKKLWKKKEYKKILYSLD